MCLKDRKGHKRDPDDNANGKAQTERMKTTIILIFSALALTLSGCTGSSHDLFSATGISNAMINTNTHTPSKGEEGRGVYLSISPRSSLDIDITGILDYVQGEPTFGSEFPRNDHSNPWIRWNFFF